MDVACAMSHPVSPGPHDVSGWLAVWLAVWLVYVSIANPIHDFYDQFEPTGVETNNQPTRNQCLNDLNVGICMSLMIPFFRVQGDSEPEFLPHWCLLG